MSKVPTTTIRESRIVDDKLNNDCFTDCSRYRKSRRKTMQTEAATSRWSGLVHSRSGSLKSCQNLLVILMLWLNLSSIECFQKPQEGESAMDFCAMRKSEFSTQSPVLCSKLEWETWNLLFVSKNSRPPHSCNSQYSIQFPFSRSHFPLQLLPTAFFHKLGKVHGFNQVFPRRYELEGLQWAIEATASQAMETNSSCESKYTMFRPIFLPSFHFIPCHSVISVMIPYPHPHFTSYIPSMCCALLLGCSAVLTTRTIHQGIRYFAPDWLGIHLHTLDIQSNSHSWLSYYFFAAARYIDLSFAIFLFLPSRKRCHRCVVIYEKHKNVLQYKESECDEVKEHLCPSALTSRSIIKTSEHDHTSDTRGVVANNTNHPNILAMKQGSSRVQSTSDHRSYDDNYSKQDRP